MFKLDNFDNMAIGECFYNSFTYTICIKVSNSRYFDLTLKHMIKMKQELRSNKHHIISVRAYVWEDDYNG